MSPPLTREFPLALGPVFPLAVSRTGRSHPGQEAAMTARASAVGYIAYLTGPPDTGAIADHLSLPTTLVFVVGLACVGIAVTRTGDLLLGSS